MKKVVLYISAICISIILCCISVVQYFAVTTFIVDGYTYSITDNGTASLRGWDYSDDTLTVPNKVGDTYLTEIADYAFRDDEKVKGLNLEKSSRLMTIGVSAFAYSGISGSLYIPARVTILGDSAFEGCTGIESVNFESKSLSLPSQFFKGCTSLNEITISNGIESIESFAFYNCTSLKSITIPRSVKSIKQSAFRNCSDFVIKGYRGSYAEQYAKDNGIDFYILDPLYGDANEDGEVNILDVTFIQKYKIGTRELTYYGQRCADVNKDGNVTVRDATLIQMKLAKIITDY